MPFDAFISYSHAEDHATAEALQRALHAFARPWYRIRAVRVFRDETNLATEKALPDAITEALGTSRYFLLLCSPKAAASPWVTRELGLWLQRHPAADHLILVQTGGEIVWSGSDFDWTRTDALPASLKGRLAAEPLWVDLRWAKADLQLSSRDPRFLLAVAKIAAPLHGKSLDDIAGDDVRIHRRNLRHARLAAAAIVLLAAFWAGAAWTARQEQKLAEANKWRAVKQTDKMVSDIALGLAETLALPTGSSLNVLNEANAQLRGIAEEAARPTTARGIVAQWLGLKGQPDLELLRRRALTLNGLSQINYRAGCFQRALDDAEEAVATAKAIGDHPDLLAKAYYRKGDALLSLRRLDEALAVFQAGAALAETVHQPNLETVRETTVARTKAAEFIWHTKGAQLALADFQAAEATLRKLVADARARGHASAALWTSDLSDLLLTIGHIHADAGRMTEARSYDEQAIAVLTALGDVASRNRTVAKRLANAEGRLGDHLVLTGALAEGRRHLETARVILDRLAGSDAADLRLSGDLGNVHHKLGESFAGEQAWSSAFAHFQQAVDAYAVILKAQPCQSTYVISGLRSRLGMSNAAERMNDHAGAATLYLDVVTRADAEAACTKDSPSALTELRRGARDGLERLSASGIVTMSPQARSALAGEGTAPVCPRICRPPPDICTGSEEQPQASPRT